MNIPFYQVDAFTSSKPFSGNPAGVCLLSSPAEEDWMQKVAFEVNQSETAFLYPETDGFRLRWFTPKIEVDLCGHATLASAHILWENKILKADSEARFYTKSGLLKAAQVEGLIQLDFPAIPAFDCDKPDLLEKSLGCAVRSTKVTGRTYIAELNSEEEVRQLQPDFELMKSFLKEKYVGVIVTALAKQPYDFVSRFFAPAAGINEDPVTGSAHCCLAPYWSSRLGKKEFKAFQASARGGELTVNYLEDRVLLQGKALTVMNGHWVS